MTVQVEYITLFEADTYFNPCRAHWKDAHDGHKVTQVMAYVPKDALSPTEQGYSGPGIPEKERRHKLWGDHAWAISSALGVNSDWCHALRLLEEHRDANKPILMKIYNYHFFNYETTKVEDYLK